MPVLKGAETPPPEIRSLNRPTRTESLYLIRNPGLQLRIILKCMSKN